MACHMKGTKCGEIIWYGVIHE